MPLNETKELIPTLPSNPHPLGRHVFHELANGNHRALVSPPPRTNKPGQVWYSNKVYDQLESNCTIEAVAGELATAPYNKLFTERKLLDEESERIAFYREAQKFDPPEWGTPHEGSATSSPYKLLREKGIITGWKWLFGEAELREYVRNYGPATCGTIWENNMFYPDENGFIHLGGAVAGGHEYRIVQASDHIGAYRIVNSWGRGWGINGRAYITYQDMASLLDQDGDAATIAA
jgi:hypothetical protein